MSDSKRKIIKSSDLDQELSLESRLDLKDSASVDVTPQTKVIHPQDQQNKNMAASIVQAAHEEAEKIRARAKQIYQEVQNRVEEAEKKGFAKGREEGLQAMTEMVLQMQKKNQEIVQGLSQQALELVLEIGRKVVGDCFTTSDEAVLSMVRQALQASMGQHLVVLVNPQDYQRIQQSQAQLLSALHATQSLTIKPSETVKPFGCVIESEMGTLEANLESQLLAIQKALGL